MATRIYTAKSHLFFDDLALFLCTLSSSLVTIEAFRMGGYTKAPSDPEYYMQFEACTLPVSLTWYPQESLMAIAANTWPTTITLLENTVHPKNPTFGIGSLGARNLHGLALQAAFVRFYEGHKDLIEAKFGTDPAQWPSEWNFSRVVRNAFAHDGTLTFRNPNARSVSWRGITYEPSEHGKHLMFRDINFVEVVTLMEDMHAAL